MSADDLWEDVPDPAETEEKAAKAAIADMSIPESERRPLSAREQLALILLADDGWSTSDLRMVFEVRHPERYLTSLAERTAREIARFEVQR